MRECLQNLLKRTPGCFDLQIFVSSVLLQRDTGGNLVEILKNISATVRARFLFEGKLRALTSEAKFTAWVLGSLPFFVTTLISIRNPDYLMPLLTDTLGNVLVLACVGMFSMGVFLMYDFSKVEV
jgi:tight adherence protein B